MFKKGDKIKRKDGLPFSSGVYIATVDYVDANNYLRVAGGKVTDIIPSSSVEKASTPRPHSEVIKAWADDVDAVVQWKDLCVWRDVLGKPNWHGNLEYRIKPEKSEVDERIETLEAELMALKEARRKEQV